MKKKTWYLVIGIVAASSGCAGLGDYHSEHGRRTNAGHTCGSIGCENSFAQVRDTPNASDKLKIAPNQSDVSDRSTIAATVESGNTTDVDPSAASMSASAETNSERRTQISISSGFAPDGAPDVAPDPDTADSPSQVDDVPSPSDLNEDGSFRTFGKNKTSIGSGKNIVVTEILDVIDAAMVTDASGWTTLDPMRQQVETIELAPARMQIQSATIIPLDRNTIQAMFGIDENFDFHTAGTVSYQLRDPIAASDIEAVPPAIAKPELGLEELLAPPVQSPFDRVAVKKAAFDPSSASGSIVR